MYLITNYHFLVCFDVIVVLVTSNEVFQLPRIYPCSWLFFTVCSLLLWLCCCDCWLHGVCLSFSNTHIRIGYQKTKSKTHRSIPPKHFRKLMKFIIQLSPLSKLVWTHIITTLDKVATIFIWYSIYLNLEHLYTQIQVNKIN